MEYRGLVVKDENNECLLFFETRKGEVSDGIPITDSQGVYGFLNEKQISLCTIQFCDGTEPKSFDYFENIEDIFFKIRDIAVLTLMNEDNPGKTALEAIKEDGDEIAEHFFSDDEIYNHGN
jgi:hypothetical protein